MALDNTMSLFDNESILITGGTGSFGKQFARAFNTNARWLSGAVIRELVRPFEPGGGSV
jgi:NAD(P)-dependent dehydrogenase (short-subunit alcohol dehydrogenase family)